MALSESEAAFGTSGTLACARRHQMAEAKRREEDVSCCHSKRSTAIDLEQLIMEIALPTPMDAQIVTIQSSANIKVEHSLVEDVTVGSPDAISREPLMLSCRAR